MPGANPSYNDITGAAVSAFLPEVMDQIMDQEVILSEIKKCGGFHTMEGSPNIIQSLVDSPNNTVQAFKGYDEFNLTQQPVFSTIAQEWKSLAGVMMQSGEEDFKNSGETQRYSLIAAKGRQLQQSIMLYLSEKMFQAGTNGKDIIGLDGMFDSDGTWSEYGGIDSDVHEFWRNKYINVNAAFSSSLQGSTAGRVHMTRMFNNCSQNGDTIDLMVTTQDIYEAYDRSLDQYHRTTDLRLGNLGFQNLLFMGKPVCWDQNQNSGRMNFLNCKRLSVIWGQNEKLQRSDFVKLPNQDARVAVIVCRMATFVHSRKRHGVLGNITV